ncbi:hypothetical protein Misp06_00916 [Microbulbifer sp. NBRC 101763]|uniref:hypothetical protein n=1 Tax=Microbulbifer TaxID=48073 RepID=UPI00036F2AB8|nr:MULTISPECIES: hypothetical protein [Microbulbifer]WHI49337.1 hypothetical protein P3339_12670 [Microbulbifer sp. MLAF003]
MLLAILCFYCTNIVRFFLPQQREFPLVDPADYYSRRYTYHYRQKKELVKWLWIGVSLVMLCFPLLPLVLGLSFFTLFLSFAILDETA